MISESVRLPDVRSPVWSVVHASQQGEHPAYRAVAARLRWVNYAGCYVQSAPTVDGSRVSTTGLHPLQAPLFLARMIEAWCWCTGATPTITVLAHRKLCRSQLCRYGVCGTGGASGCDDGVRDERTGSSSLRRRDGVRTSWDAARNLWSYDESWTSLCSRKSRRTVGGSGADVLATTRDSTQEL